MNHETHGRYISHINIETMMNLYQRLGLSMQHSKIKESAEQKLIFLEKIDMVPGKLV